MNKSRLIALFLSLLLSASAALPTTAAELHSLSATMQNTAVTQDTATAFSFTLEDETPEESSSAEDGSGQNVVSAPRTGDLAHIGAWVILLAGSIIGCTCLIQCRKRQ